MKLDDVWEQLESLNPWTEFCWGPHRAWYLQFFGSEQTLHWVSRSSDELMSQASILWSILWSASNPNWNFLVLFKEHEIDKSHDETALLETWTWKWRNTYCFCGVCGLLSLCVFTAGREGVVVRQRTLHRLFIIVRLVLIRRFLWRQMKRETAGNSILKENLKAIIPMEKTKKTKIVGPYSNLWV